MKLDQDTVAAYEDYAANRTPSWQTTDAATETTTPATPGAWNDGVPLPDEPPTEDVTPAPFGGYEDNAPAVAAPNSRNRSPAIGRSLKLTPASQIETSVVEWLIPDWVPSGAVTLLAGREGIGKSTIAADWVAQATRGELTNGVPMSVGYVVTEDSREHTVVPRLQAAGADLDRVLFIDATVPDDLDPSTVYETSLDLPGDFPVLRNAVIENGIGLIILDAAKSVMNSNLKDNSDTDVRRFLEPMSRIADETKCSFIGLAHFGKRESVDTGKLLLGSAAWSQVARSVVAVAANKDEGTLKVWNSKGNLAPRERTMEAQISSAPFTASDGRTTEVGKVQWLGECDENGADLLAPDRDDREDRTEVEQWLEDYLAQNGPCLRATVIDDARKQRVGSEATIKRAFKSIGGQSENSGFPRRSHWHLPGRGYTGTATEPPENDTPGDIRTAILDVLDTDRGQKSETIERTVTEILKGVTHENVTEQLEHLVKTGTVHNVNDKYTKE